MALIKETYKLSYHCHDNSLHAIYAFKPQVITKPNHSLNTQ